MRVNQEVIATMDQNHQIYIGRLLEYVENSEIKVETLVVYGSAINHTRYNSSDVDCYIYINDPKGYILNRTMIIQGVGYDVFCMNSSRLEGIAKLKEDLLPLLLDGVCLYVSDIESYRKWEGLVHQAKTNLLDLTYITSACKRHEHELMDLKKRLNSGINDSDTLILLDSYLYHQACIFAYKQSGYLHHGKKSMEHWLTRMHPQIPNWIIECVYDRTLKVEKLILRVEQVGVDITKKAETSIEQPLPQLIEKSEIKDYFQELVSYFRKIEYAYNTKSLLLLYFYTSSLQKELNLLMPSMGIRSVDLVSDLRSDRLNQWIKQVQEVEMIMAHQLVTLGIELDQYNDFHEIKFAY